MKKIPPTFVCAACGTERVRRKRNAGKCQSYDYRQKYCNQACYNRIKIKPYDRHSWHLDRHGYKITHMLGKEVREHRIIMEQLLGRPLLPTETVHHKNGVRHDNSPGNLELWDSRHGRGQKVVQKIQFAKDFLASYGYEVLFDVPYPAG